MNYYLLQIEMVGPEGDKLIWILSLFILVALALFFAWRTKKMKWPTFLNQVKVTILKNKIYHPSIIHLSIINNSKHAITIEHPVIRFKKLRRSMAYKIKSVNAKQIYPLYLESKQTHTLPISLEPFYEYNKKLKKFSFLRVEFKFNQTKEKRSKYLLLKPTIFRKAKR